MGILARVYADDATILVIRWAGGPAGVQVSRIALPTWGTETAEQGGMGRKESAPPSSEKVRGGRIGGCGWEEEPSLSLPHL